MAHPKSAKPVLLLVLTAAVLAMAFFVLRPNSPSHEAPEFLSSSDASPGSGWPIPTPPPGTVVPTPTP